ncbi:MAG: SDR family oxidoreductase [Reyranella sp.]|uniref:SDR family oxidoreductase n=1 Tax=Reyranella sp. TaxID=1929291 RepID=UPI0025D86C65|nr:SDR family oxidoreductase [Reyranella sp.]MBR2813391.1 SDR family oxidoreductase [Reyranella sp.]
MTRRLFIFGLGYSGLEIAKLARAQGFDVAGTCTTAEKAAQLRHAGFDVHLFDGTAALPEAVLRGASHVLCSIAPTDTGDPALHTCRALLGHAPWLGYLSTTGVYGDHGSGWVDETTPAVPGHARSIARLAAEQAWRDLARETGATLDILRLPGIYGPGRSAIDQVKAGTARRIDKPGQFFSRIHVADIANATLAAMVRIMGRTMAHTMAPTGATALWNVADDLPAANSDVVAHAFELLGRPVPPAIPWEQIASTLSPMARSFYRESRRVRNDRLKRDLGVVLRYPTYREGLKAIAEA